MIAFSENAIIVLVSALIVLSFPLLVVAFYRLRLGARRRALLSKLLELNLEGEYLKVFHYAEWETLVADKTDVDRRIRASFVELFTNQFRGDNSVKNYIVPIFLTLLTTSLFALYVLWLWAHGPSSSQLLTHPALFAIAGSLVFVYPMFVSHYASLSLNPPTILELNGKIWLSALIGVVATTVIKDVAQPLVAFLSSLLPIAALELFKTRVFGEKAATATAAEAAATSEMLEIIRYDRDLLTQLDYIGVRSVLELAYENPIRLFVEADPILIVCIDMVDQANLHLYVPDASIRRDLNTHGIRTAIDLMTQLYDEFPSRNDATKRELRFLDSDERLPDHLQPAMVALANAMKLENVDVLRNLIAMMVANPQLQYVFYLWASLSERVDKAFADAEAGNASRLRLSAHEQA